MESVLRLLPSCWQVGSLFLSVSRRGDSVWALPVKGGLSGLISWSSQGPVSPGCQFGPSGKHDGTESRIQESRERGRKQARAGKDFRVRGRPDTCGRKAGKKQKWARRASDELQVSLGQSNGEIWSQDFRSRCLAMGTWEERGLGLILMVLHQEAVRKLHCSCRLLGRTAAPLLAILFTIGPGGSKCQAAMQI